MLSRRSESCPRLARKEFTHQAQQPQQPVVPSTTGTARGCTLQDLGPEDRQKVAKLLKQVVDLGQEVLQLKQQRDELRQQAHASVQREQELQDGNQQLQKEHQLLKKKLAQVLLVLRASQAKVAAFEAIQQGAQIAQSAVEVQTEPISIVDPEARSSTASNATACAVRSAGIPLAQTAGNAELTGRMDSAAVRASLAMPAGGPPFLHVAPGAHVNITINHAPEPMTTAGAPTPPVGGGPVAQANKFFEAEEAESITATSPTGPEDGCNEGVASSLAPHCGASDYGVALVASPAAPAVIAIPTTTTTAVLGTVAASGTAFLPRTEVGPSEVSMGSCSAVGACPYGPGAGNLPSWPLQQTPVGPEAYDCVLGPAAMPKGPRHASAASSGQSICGKPPGPRNILVDATQRFEAVPVHEVRVDSREALTASPMIVPPSDEVVAAASRLLGWQAQHGCAADEGICAATAPSTIPRDPRSGRKVLSYDPAIGQSGAFYFIDVPDMAADPAGTMGVLVSGSAQAVRPGGGSVAGSQPVPSPPHDVTATAMPGTEHLVAVGPQLAPQALQPEGEATFRPWSDGHGASMSDRAGAPVSAAHQHHRNPHLHQHQLPVSERMAPASPCSSYTTETTNTCTPFLHGVTMPPQLPGSNDTPASSSMSLSRMALALDEMARRQRWDVQPPGGVGQPHEAAALGWAAHPSARGGHATQLAAPGAVVRHGMLGNGDFGTVGATGVCAGHGSRKYPQSASGQPVQLLRHGSTGSIAAAAVTTPAAAAAAVMSPLHAAHDAAQVDVLSTCGSTSNWLGGNDVADRYDESLVDILSQADEELEYQQHQNHQEHLQRPQQRARPHVNRRQSQASAAAAAPLTVGMSVRSRAIPAAVPISLSEVAPTRAKKAASAEALLAANLYEENDVLSVILEQEGRV